MTLSQCSLILGTKSQFKRYNEIYSKSQMSNTHKRIISTTMYWEQGVLIRNPIFNDKKIRKAILHSINWSEIAEIAGGEKILTIELWYSSQFYKDSNFICPRNSQTGSERLDGERRSAKVYSKAMKNRV